MNEQKAFWKGFGIATGLAVVFLAGRATAGPVETLKTLDDTSRELSKITSELSDIESEIGDIESSVTHMKNYGIKVNGPVTVRGETSGAYPVYVKQK